MSFEKWSDEFAQTNTGGADHVLRRAGQADEADGDRARQTAEVAPEVWRLRLYVSGESTRSLVAFANLKRLCELYLTDRHQIEIVDLLEHPLLARDDEIVAVPTLVRLAPRPVRQIIGDLSDTDEVLDTLQIRAKNL